MDNRCMGCGSNRYKSQRALTVHLKKCEGYKDLRREADAVRRANAMKRANAEKLESEGALKRMRVGDVHAQVPSSSSSHAPQPNDVPQTSDNDTVSETGNATGPLAVAPYNAAAIPVARPVRSGRSGRFPAPYKDFLSSSLTPLPRIRKLPPRLPPPECTPSLSPEPTVAVPTTAPPVYETQPEKFDTSPLC